MAKQKAVPAIRVRAKVAHTQPGTQAYRAEGDEFDHIGDPYEHVEKLADKPVVADEDEE